MIAKLLQNRRSAVVDDGTRVVEKVREPKRRQCATTYTIAALSPLHLRHANRLLERQPKTPIHHATTVFCQPTRSTATSPMLVAFFSITLQFKNCFLFKLRWWRSRLRWGSESGRWQAYVEERGVREKEKDEK